MRRYLISENVDNSGWPLKVSHFLSFPDFDFLGHCMTFNTLRKILLAVAQFRNLGKIGQPLQEPSYQGYLSCISVECKIFTCCVMSNNSPLRRI